MTPAPDAAGRAVRWLTWLRPLADAIAPVTLLRGTSLHSGEPTTMLVAGSLPRVQWLVDRFFAGDPARESLGHVPAWRLMRMLRRSRHTADLTIARVARLSAARLGFDDDWLPVPDWVGMRLLAPYDLAAIARHSGSAADDMRRTRRGGWSSGLSHHAEDLDAFRRDFYLPFMRNRHRDEAYVKSPRYLRRRFRRGGILWLLRDGKRMAGILFEQRHDVMDMVAIGVAGGDLHLVKEGVLAALYVHVIEHAQRGECRAIDLRGSRPSPADGLTRYKRKWGASIYDRADVLSTTFVHWHRPTPAVVAFLTHTPLIFRDGDGLSALGVAASGADAAGLHVTGMRRVIVLTPSGGANDRATAHEDCVLVPLPVADGGPRAVLASARGADD